MPYITSLIFFLYESVDWCVILFLLTGLVETDPEGVLTGFAEVVQMEPEKAEW